MAGAVVVDWRLLEGWRSNDVRRDYRAYAQWPVMLDQIWRFFVHIRIIKCWH
jgi:hypothetical protein